MSIESSLFNLLQNYPNHHIIIAYSGGVDSQVLLHALVNIKNLSVDKINSLEQSISACHVNHGLSEYATAWEDFAQQQCDLRQVPLDICRVNVAAKAQYSLEELARDARYDAIKEVIANKQFQKVIVLTGHHNDDQVETFLLALKRGSGLKGLSAMKQEMALGKATLVRPLLNVSRNEIEAYAQQNNLNWIEDESNKDISFDRNFLRHKVLPALTNRWPSFLKTVNRSAEHCQEAEQLLTELAQQDLNRIQVAHNALCLTQLGLLSSPRFNNLIRYFLSINQCLMPSTAQLAQLKKQLLSSSDKAPAVKVGDHWLRRFKHHVYLTSEFNDVSNFQVQVNTQNKELIQLPDLIGELIFEPRVKSDSETYVNSSKPLNCTLFIKAPVEDQQVSVRFKHSNPICTPDYRQHSRPLKKVLQELDIPTWQRKRLPFIYYNEELVAVLGHFVCKDFMVTNADEILKLTWVKSQ